MKKNYKSWGTLLLGTAIAAGCMLGGCSKSSQGTSRVNQNETVKVTDNFNATGLPILKEKETFKIAVPQASTIRTAAEKQCVIDTEKATNIHIEWIEIPKSGWKEKINIMFSTDSLPDAIIGDVEMAKYYEQVVALDDYLKEYAPAVTAFFATRDDYPKSLIAPDGKIHALPAGDESLENLIDSQLWINSDWLKKVGKEVPATPEELKDVLIAFRDQDPNGNGLKDEIPLTFSEPWGWGDSMENLFGPWGIVENSYHVFTRDNKVTFSAKEHGYYDALVYLHGLYKEGLIDKEAFTISDEQYSARGAAGDVIGVMANYSGSDSSVDNGSVGNDRYLPLPVLKGKDGTQMVGLNTLTKSGGFVITNSCKDPQALVRWYDYINSSLEQTLAWGRGQEGVRWKILNENGKEIPEFLTLTDDVLKNNGGYKTAAEYRNAVSFSGQTPSLWRLEYDEAIQFDDKAPKINWKRKSVLEQKQFGVISLPQGMASQENEERRTILLADIDNYLKKFIADSVINGIDEAKWNTHLKTLDSLKVDEYTALCQEYVDEYANR